MSSASSFSSSYGASRAIVIGINAYSHASPLDNARQDAEVLGALLTQKFSFPSENIIVLLDQAATRAAITSAFLSMVNAPVGPDDRIIFFFAGHGSTQQARRGEVGYLIPHDGNPSDLSTLIRWDDLTRNADLIPAKHIFFLMDACYGGLALTRVPQPGSSRYLKDMLRRHARQVLTSGKPDETVSDGGGPRPGHSIFTGHLLEALDGKAADESGILTASRVMAYVYDHVAKDQQSQQSPHYGFIDGDGDMVLLAPQLAELVEDDTVDQDRMIQFPPVHVPQSEENQPMTFADQVKDYLSEPRHRIRLDDLAAAELRTVLYETRDELFPTSPPQQPDAEMIAERLKQYEAAVERVLTLIILVARWGTQDHQPIIERILTRLADNAQSNGGYPWLAALKWYPVTLLMYAAGVSSISSKNYLGLATMFTAITGSKNTHTEPSNVLVSSVEGFVAANQAIKSLKEHTRHYFPASEYLFKHLQSPIDDLLYLGSNYELYFDFFEIFQSLSHTITKKDGGSRIPQGRFAYKHRYDGSPLKMLQEEAGRAQAAWPPLRFNLFSGSYEKFAELAGKISAELSSSSRYF